MFMEIAKIVAKRGTCDRAQVGAVLVENGKNIVAIGYNGAPAGKPHCDDVGHLIVDGHCVRTVHAEENCLNKVFHYHDEHDYTLYVTHFPCMSCTLKIVAARSEYDQPSSKTGLYISRIVYLEPYRKEDEPWVRENLLKGVGITVEQYVEPTE
jgi:dCMP deaminase